MTNEERVADVLSSLRGLRLKPSEQAARLAKRGLIAPDPPPRYALDFNGDIVRDGKTLVGEFHSADSAERATVLAALNALPEEGEKP